MKSKNKYQLPDKEGYFGQFGGSFVPLELRTELKKVEQVYLEMKDDSEFKKELSFYYREYIGRPSNLYFAQRLTENIGGAQIFLKREDLNHTGAHKINNAIGQALLAKKMGKKKLIAETGAGQHGVAVATVAALMGMKCDIYMGERDIKNQSINVYRMQLLGAKVISVTSGQATLKDAVDQAINAYVNEPSAYYLIGSVVGPAPLPMIVREFQKVIGQEAKEQSLAKFDRLPDYLVACIGGGSNAMGIFYDFIDNEHVELIGVEPAGLGSSTKRHGMSLAKGQPGVIHGFKCSLLFDEAGEIAESYSAASGLDYPGVGPEPSYLAQLGRLQVVAISDQEAVEAFCELSAAEGIIPALESAHAVAYAMKLAKKLPKEKIIIVNLSGRGDKDVENVYKNLLPKGVNNK